jgi:hypothetical protein
MRSRGQDVTRPPWEYLFESFNSDNFPDIFHPTWIASAILLVALLLLYYVRTRTLHRHAPYLEMWEWLLWSGLITFGMLLVEAVFVFDFFIVLATMFIGLGTLVWIRFIRFPPFLAAYETRLAKQRYISRQKYADPEATIKKKGPGGRRQRQRRRR